ncbi:hypothetical protein D3C81_1887590 [compost metagenome]
MPVAKLHIVIGKGAFIQCKRNLTRFPGLELHLLEALQLLQRADYTALHVTNIELNDLFAGPAAGILDSY